MVKSLSREITVPVFPSRKTAFSRTKITVFVPSTSGKTKPLTKRQFTTRMKKVASRMTRDFGGTTRFRGKGTFVSTAGRTKGKVIAEKVGVVESFVPAGRLNRENRKNFSQFLQKSKREWGQETIAVSIESPKRKAEEVHFV